MKLSSNLGRVSTALLKIVEDPELLDPETRASNKVKISAASGVIDAEAIQMNDDLQYARIAEREARERRKLEKV
jgi:hypothetical protein